MNCEKYLILIDDFVEGELDSENAGQVNSHLSNCRECDSYYQILREEKEVYGQFLFDVEPSKDLWNQFQTKIETVTNVQNVEKATASGGWNFNIFSRFWLYPALGFAAILVFCAYGFWKLAPSRPISNDEYAAKTNPAAEQTQNQSFGETPKNKTEIAATEAKNDKTNDSPKLVKVAYKSKVSGQKSDNKNLNRVSAGQTQPKAKKVSDGANEELQANSQVTEEQLQFKALETETAQQIEKIELLLRSFRNARVVEGSTVYDVGYEKQQARKLLGKNVQLRQIAESYGALYTEELLDKAEPFLLDIANLDNNPQPEQVLDIKERVKSQNIIASLQVY